MSRDAQHVVLLLLGGALLRIGADGTYRRYVLPSHGWLVLAAGLVLVLLAVAALVRDRRAPPSGPCAAPVAWLLTLPTLVVALVAPPALGSDAVARAGEVNAVVPVTAVFPPLPAGPAPEVGLGEFVQRALFDTAGSVRGRTVTLVGFVARRDGEIDLARLRIVCCAADARPSVVRLAGDTGEAVPDTWLRVTGVLVPGEPGDRGPPAVSVRAVEQVDAPADPYEY